MDPKRPFNITAGLEYIRIHPQGPEVTNKNPFLGVTDMEYLAAGLVLDAQSRTLQTLTPYITAITLVFLGAILARRVTRKERHRIQDLVIYGLCLRLLWTDQVLPVLLASNAALGVLTWIMLPTPSNSKDLPAHEAFMLNIMTTPPATRPQDDTEIEADRCIMCWEDNSDTLLACLPCQHFACTICLGLLHNQNNSTCPLCSLPLWRKHNQTLNLNLQKLRTASYTITILQFLVSGVYNVRQQDYYKAMWHIPVLLASTIIPLAHIIFTVKRDGEDWWWEPKRKGISWERVVPAALMLAKWYEIWNSNLGDIGDEFTVTITPSSNPSVSAPELGG
ncbi:hypothetical protein LTR78_001916 [Recurvomyces mirabilis]|uniref:RING-type domain-containing protein n=1 Tax=Recurvomyces mirabilis TaxID=574656 RepID=A0AAE1C598_9PEZI|nr:hypothetical protein LTR78_001916 [Recurvomyces mirabilis]KAK5156645.1 hypothetical protein LTS14_004857 [Recurvomyces mirabilis]